MFNRTHEIIASDWLAAKSALRAAQENLDTLSRELAGLLDHKEEGAVTHTLDGYTVTINGVINRKVDWAAFDAAVHASGLSPEAAPCKTKRELDMPGLRYYRNNEPMIYARLATAITATPGKTSVTVTRKE